MNIKSEKGFSLIEIAIVVVIIAFMLGSLLGPLGNRMEQGKTEQTSAQLDEIVEAIYGFVVINGRLPCWDVDDDGIEDRTGANNACAALPGGTAQPELPWITLGTSQFDEWGQNFIYFVDFEFVDDTTVNPHTTNTAASCANIVSTITFDICSIGAYNVTDGVTADDPTDDPVANSVPAIVFSAGKPKGTLHVDETSNLNKDTNIIHRDFRPENSPAPFNDIVRWIPTNILIGKMVEAQRLP